MTSLLPSGEEREESKRQLGMKFSGDWDWENRWAKSHSSGVIQKGVIRIFNFYDLAEPKFLSFRKPSAQIEPGP